MILFLTPAVREAVKDWRVARRYAATGSQWAPALAAARARMLFLATGG